MVIDGEWVDHDLVASSKSGTPVSPGNLDQTLDRLVVRAGVPRFPTVLRFGGQRGL